MQLEFSNLERPKDKKKKASKSSSKSKLKFAELFAGIGLMRLGLENANWECVYANDIDPNKQEIYQANFKSDHFHLEDIWNLSPKHVPRDIQMITASFPCVDLSLAGNRKGLAGSDSGTFWAFIQLLNGLKKEKRIPDMVLVENVLGFASSHGGKDFKEAIQTLNSKGYVTDAFVVDAKHFVPQSRPRLFILGVQKHLAPEQNKKEFQQRLHRSSPTWKPNFLKKIISETANANWTIFDLPEVKPHGVQLKDVLEDLPKKDERWWDSERVEKTLEQMSPLHKARVDELIDLKSYTYGTIYRRKRAGGTRAELRLDGIAGCLRTPRGGSSRQIVAKLGRGEVSIRWMTAREYARLQGVDDSFVLSKSENKSLFGFGDAVCVPAITWIAENIVNPIFQDSVSEVNKS